MFGASLDTLHEINKRSKSIEGSLQTHQETNNELLESLDPRNNTPLTAPAAF